MSSTSTDWTLRNYSFYVIAAVTRIFNIMAIARLASAELRCEGPGRSQYCTVQAVLTKKARHTTLMDGTQLDLTANPPDGSDALN